MASSTLLTVLTLQLWLVGLSASYGINYTQIGCEAQMFQLGRSADNNNNNNANARNFETNNNNNIINNNNNNIINDINDNTYTRNFEITNNNNNNINDKNNHVRSFDRVIDPRYQSSLYQPAGREPLDQKMGKESLNRKEQHMAGGKSKKPDTKSTPRPKRSWDQRNFRDNDTDTRIEEEEEGLLRSTLLPCGDYLLDDGEVVVINVEPMQDPYNTYHCNWKFEPLKSGSRLYFFCPVFVLPNCTDTIRDPDNFMTWQYLGPNGITYGEIEYTEDTDLGEIEAFGETDVELKADVTGSSPRIMCTVRAAAAPKTNASPPTNPCSTSCGSGVPTNLPLTNGGQSEDGDWPSTGLVVASSLYYGEGWCQVLCAVTLIGDRHLLTSAACVLNAEYASGNYHVYVILGANDLSDVNDDREQHEIANDGFLVHPAYDDQTGGFAIGMLVLDDDVKFDDRIQPACLPLNNADYEYQEVVMAGYVKDYYGNRTPVKRGIELFTWDWLTCRDAYGIHLDLSMMCASGDGPCHKNPGGGLLWVSPTGKATVVAVEIYNPGCPCSCHPAVYIDVAKVMDWIARIMECCGYAGNPEAPPSEDYEFGQANTFTKARIVNGTESGVNEFPWHASLALKIKNNQTAQPFCGAVIIARMFLLTTASCATAVRNPDLMIDVMVGYHDVLDTSNTPEAVKYGVHYVIVHEDYNPWYISDDIAIVVTDTPMFFDAQNLVAPVLLPTRSRCYTGYNATVTGHGLLDYWDYDYPTELYKVTVDIISNADCTDYYGYSIYPTEICAYGGGKDSCIGDGGGALVVETDTGAWEVVGLVAWGIGCAWDGYPGVYTRVPAYLDWIKKHTYGTNLHRN